MTGISMSRRIRSGASVSARYKHSAPLVAIITVAPRLWSVSFRISRISPSSSVISMVPWTVFIAIGQPLHSLSSRSHAIRSGYGQRKVKVLPRFGSESTQIFPPCSSTNALEMARPRPVPLGLRRRPRPPDKISRRSSLVHPAKFLDHYRSRPLASMRLHQVYSAVGRIRNGSIQPFSLLIRHGYQNRPVKFILWLGRYFDTHSIHRARALRRSHEFLSGPGWHDTLDSQ